METAEQWLENYGDHLFNYASLRINNKQLAEDLVQETFLSALESINSFKNASSEKTWLTSILKHKIIDQYRKKMAAAALNIGELAGELPEFIEEGANKGRWKIEYAPGNWQDAPDQLYENSEFREILQNCLFNAPDSLRMVFVLRVIEGMSSENVCKELAITSSNFWVNASGKKLFKKMFGNKLVYRKKLKVK